MELSTDLKPTIKETFFRNASNPSKASVQDASSRKSSLPPPAPWVSSMMSATLPFDLCLCKSVRGLGGREGGRGEEGLKRGVLQPGRQRVCREAPGVSYHL